MENKKLTQCPICGYSQKEPLLINGQYHIEGHYCLDAKYVRATDIDKIEHPNRKEYGFNDLELTEKDFMKSQLSLLKESLEIQNRILQNVRFFFWLFIITAILLFMNLIVPR